MRQGGKYFKKKTDAEPQLVQQIEMPERSGPRDAKGNLLDGRGLPGKKNPDLKVVKNEPDKTDKKKSETSAKNEEGDKS